MSDFENEGVNWDDFDALSDDDDMEADEDFDDEPEIISLTDEDGEEKDYAILDSVEYNGAAYVLLVPADEIDDDETDAIILKDVSSEDDEDPIFEDPAEEEFDAVSGIFRERENDDYDFED